MTAGLTLYVLMWPVIVFAVMAVIGGAFYKEVRQARKEGRRVI